jgi:predicted transcriptional regulator
MYKTEAAFVETLTNSLRNHSGIYKQNEKESTLIRKEVSLGYGIADIVVAKYSNKNTIERSNFLNFFDVSLVKIIKNKKQIGIEEIIKITKSSKPKVHISLKKLIDNKIITTEKETYYSFCNYKSILTNSIAIEAKLKNWKRALNQAYRYKWFSQKSFVFIPEENIQPAYNNLELFKKMNVGLGTISKSKKINILFKPKKERPYSEEMWMFLNECILVNLSSTSKTISKKINDN